MLLALLARLQSRSGLSLATDVIFEPDVLATFNFVKSIHRILLLGLVLVLVRRPLQHYFGFVHDVYSLRNHGNSSLLNLTGLGLVANVFNQVDCFPGVGVQLHLVLHLHFSESLLLVKDKRST